MSRHDFNSLRFLASAGNALFILWLLFNWMDEAAFQFTYATPWYLVFIILLFFSTSSFFKPNPLRYLAIAGNAFYGLYFLYDLRNWASFTGPEALSHVVLIVLLCLNAFLLFTRHPSN